MLWPYRAEPFIPGNKVGRVYVTVADGTTPVFSRPNPLEMLSLVRVQNDTYKQSSGGLIKTPTGFILSETPPENAIVISVGTVRFEFRAYDQAVVAGNPNPNVAITPIYIVDAEHIASNQYEKAVGEDAILLNFVDLDENYGGLAEWMRFGYSNPATGAAPSVWLDPGEPLELQDFTWNSELSLNTSALDTTLFVEDAADLIATETTIFLRVDHDPNTDHVQVESVNTSTGEITLVTPLTYSHLAGAKVYLMGAKVYGKLILPTPANGPTNYLDIGLNAKFDEISRLS